MMRVLIDVDLILEALLNRSGFVADAEEAYEMLQSQRIRGYVSELGLDKIYSVTSKLGSSESAEEIVAAIKQEVGTYPVDSTLVQQARSLNIRDFESAVEVACATAMGIGAILTQDPQVFAGADLPVLQVCDLWQRQNLERILKKDASPVLLVGELLELQRLEELLEKYMERFREKEFPEEALDDGSRYLDLSHARQNFDAHFMALLELGNPKTYSRYAFINRNLRQFNLADSDGAASILNEVYLRGVQVIEQGGYINNPFSWIKAAAFNVIRAKSRQQRRLQLCSDRLLSLVEPTVSALELEFGYNELQALRMALKQLDSSERIILHLRYVQELSWTEVSEQLACEGEEIRSCKALRKRGERILQRLRHLYHDFLSK
jgi:DNA-directed RNA polymerase specialized sigma24 family protein/predicted nucleic acid-binding protein